MQIEVAKQMRWFRKRKAEHYNFCLSVNGIIIFMSLPMLKEL